MDHKRDPEGPDDVVMHHSYPSPTVEDHGYAQAAAPHDHGAEQRPDHVGYHTADDMSESHDPSRHELHELQREIQDEMSGPHESHTSVDLAELQLAAQLTQGLAAQNQARQASDIIDVRDGQAIPEHSAGHETHPAADPNGHHLAGADGLPMVQGPLQNHDSHHDHDLQERIQAQLQNQQQHELQATGPHPGQPPSHHSYLSSAQAHQSAVPNLNLHSLVQAGYSAVGDGIPPRKRSKVSRACDECRRKKIKCDAVSETGDQSCSNCRRSSTTCLFSRVPQKRGPSKGYIKELADRIFTIEGRLGGEAAGPNGTPGRQSDESFSSPAVGDKRPYESISGENLSAATPTKSGGAWGTEPRPIQPYQSSASRPSLSVNDFSPRAIAPATPTPRVLPVSLMDELPDGPSDHFREIDDDSFQVYLTTIHPIFPMLASTKARVQSILSQCPHILREAFLDAFHDTARVFQEPRGTTNGEAAHQGALPFSEWEADEVFPDRVTDLVSLQTFTAIALRMSYLAPVERLLQASPLRQSPLSHAIDLAFSMKMYKVQPTPVPEPEFDPNSDDNVSLRAWWTIVMLDRWNAIGTGSMHRIPGECVNIVPGLKPVLGTSGYVLVRMSDYIVDLLRLLNMPGTASDDDKMFYEPHKYFMRRLLASFADLVPVDWVPSTNPLPYLVMWHLRILSCLCFPDPNSEALLELCKDSAALLIGNADFVSPLSHHFACLTTMVVLELSKVDATREEALNLLKEITDGRLPSSPYDRAIGDKILERLRPTTTGSINSQHLQQLADLATATDDKDSTQGPKSSDEVSRNDTAVPESYRAYGFDPRPILQAGYLNYFNDGDNE